MYRVALILVLLIALGSTPADAQARIGGGRGGRTFHSGHSGRGFIHHFPAHRNFGTSVIYPYYPFYSEPMYEPPAPAPTVVVVPAERESQPAVAAQPQRLVPPAVIDLPVVVERSGVQLRQRPATVFILADGRRVEAKRYSITYSSVEISEPRRPALQIPISQLDLDATLTTNHQRGIDLEFPRSQGELYLTF